MSFTYRSKTNVLDGSNIKFLANKSYETDTLINVLDVSGNLITLEKTPQMKCDLDGTPLVDIPIGTKLIKKADELILNGQVRIMGDKHDSLSEQSQLTINGLLQVGDGDESDALIVSAGKAEFKLTNNGDISGVEGANTNNGDFKVDADGKFEVNADGIIEIQTVTDVDGGIKLITHNSNIHLEGETKILSLQDATTSDNAALVVKGGVGINRNLIVGTSLDVTGNTSSSSLDVTGNTSSDSLDVTGNTSSGSLDVTGNTSSASLDVTGSTSSASLDVTGNTSSGSLGVIGNTSTNSLNVTNKTTTSSLEITDNTSSGSLDVSGNTSSGSLDVTGNTSSGSLGVIGNTSTNSLNVTNKTTTSSLEITDNTSSGSLDVSGNTSSGSLDVTGNTSSGSLGVIGNTSTNSLNVTNKTTTGSLEITDSLTVTGSTSYSSLNVTGNTSSGSLGVTGDTSLSTLNSTGATSLATSGGAVNISKTGVMTTVKGALNVDEDTKVLSITESTGIGPTADPTTGALTVNGGVGINKNLNVQGSITIKDNTASLCVYAVDCRGIENGGQGITGTGSIDGATTIKASSTLDVSGTVTFGDTLDVNGPLTVNSTATIQPGNDASLQVVDEYNGDNTPDDIDGLWTVELGTDSLTLWNKNHKVTTFKPRL